MPAAPIHQYLPRLVREWDDEAAGRLHRAIDGSMVFVDVSGFTKMSERLARHGKVGAEEVTEVIGGTFDRLLGEAYAYGASLLKFGGDALLLFFQGDGHYLRAAAAAADMRRSLRDLGRLKTSAGLVSLRMSVGVHSGLFDFFMVGESHRELIVAGPAATATTAMEAAASAGQILLSPASASLLPKRNVGKALGPGFLLAGHVEVDRVTFEPAHPKPELHQFLARGLREPLLSGDVDPEHRPIAIGFIHFMEFDDLIAGSGYERAAQALDRLVRTIQQAVDRRGVTFLASDIAPDGGKIILTAGVPQATGNDEEQMLLALREIVSVEQDLPIQVGVNWGPVFVGEIGPHYRRTYTVMGDTVNLAARLMAKAQAQELLATTELLEGSRTLFETRELEPFLVKGKKLPVKAFAVGDPTGSRAADIATPLAGRAQELEILEVAWESAAASRGRLVELVADPGMGKTRLLQEFLLRSGDSRVIRGECRLYQAATPYFPFRTLLRQALDLEGLEPKETADKLAGLVQEIAPDLTPWLALIGVVLNVEIEPSPEVAQLDDQFRPARTVAAVGTLLEAVITARTLMVIEDTHWMDDASRELLAGLLFGLERQPWLLILTRRPGEAGFVAPNASHVASIELQPLTQEQAEALIISATADHPLLPSQVEALAARAAGNPLFLVELLRSLKSGGDVASLPHSVEGLIAARVDRLPPADRQLLRRLAVMGNGFQVEHTGAVLPAMEAGSRIRAIRRLGDFITMNHTGWVQFRHALIRDVAYESLPFKSRSELHRRVGDSIRATARDNPDSQAELLSLHYFHAQNWADAWHFSRVAGDSAKAVYANQAAGTFYGRALAAARYLKEMPDEDRAEVSQSLGDVLEQAGLYDQALEAYRRSMRLSGGDGFFCADLHLKRAQVRMRKGGYATALRDIAEGLRIVGDRSTPAAVAMRARLISLRSTVRMAQQRPREALALAEQAAAEARVAGEMQALARAFTTMDWAHFVLGHPDQVVHGDEAVKIYESLGLLDKAADVINNMGGFAYFSGRWDESISLYTRSRETYLRAGNDVLAAMVGANMGEVLLSQAKLKEAEPILDEAVRVLRAAGNQDDAINAELHLAHLMSERGDAARASDLLLKVRKDALDLGQTLYAFEAGLYLAACKLQEGDPQGALDGIAEATARGGEEAKFFEAKRARISAAALVEMERFEEASAELESGLRSALDLGLPHDEALIRVARISLAHKTGVEPAADEVEKTNRLLAQLGIEQAVAVV
jgi:class 3 adenylate cyclase/tetratricopeptide (TPR) repeat protein